MVVERGFWYHSMEVAPGVVTPGWFDLRPIVDRMPWPDVRGKRCLDVGPYDGYLSFELERRGAAEVVAADIADPAEWDLTVDIDATDIGFRQIVGSDPGAGFEVARTLLGSSVERVELSAYDLSPERLGRFDLVVCGSLLLHLRDPIRALIAMRSVCDGVLMSAEEILLGQTLLHRRRPITQLNGAGNLVQWWIPNAAGHERMLYASGFEVIDRRRPYSISLGPAHPPPKRGPRAFARRLAQRALTGGTGLLHSAVLARPRV